MGGQAGLLGVAELPADLDQVVGEYPMATPGAGALEAVQAGAVPAEAVLEAAEAALTAGTPLDQPAEATLALDCWRARPARPRRGMATRGHAQVGQPSRYSAPANQVTTTGCASADDY